MSAAKDLWLSRLEAQQDCQCDHEGYTCPVCRREGIIR